MSEDLRAQVQQLRRQAAEAAAGGDAAAAQRACDALLSLDDQALAAADPAITRDMLDGAATLVGAGDLARAQALLVKGIQALARSARATPADLIVPLSNLLAVHDRAGNAAGRNQAAVAIGAIAERLEGPLPGSAATALMQLGQIYERGGNHVAALTMYRPVHASMLAQPDVPPGTLLVWLLAYARALIAAGQPDNGFAVGRQALDVAERALEVDPAERLEAFAVVATAASRHNAAPAAQEALERGAALAEVLEGGATSDRARLATLAGVIYHNLASLYLRQGRREQYPRAAALMQRALALILERGREGSAEHAGALGQLAVIVEAQGDLDAADRLYTDSAEVYERAPDTPSAEFSDFLTDLGLMRLHRGRPADAIGPLRRALELREASPDEAAPRRADAASNLATACFEAGDLAEARREYTRALDLRLAALAAR